MKVVVVENLPGEGVYTAGGVVVVSFGSPGSENTLPGPEFPISSDRGQHGDTRAPEHCSLWGRPAEIASPTALYEAQSPPSAGGINVPNLPKLPETAAVLLPPSAHLFKGPFPTGSPPPSPPGDSSFEKACQGGGAAAGTRASNLSSVPQSPGPNKRGEPRRPVLETLESQGRVLRASLAVAAGEWRRPPSVPRVFGPVAVGDAASALVPGAERLSLRTFCRNVNERVLRWGREAKEGFKS